MSDYICDKDISYINLSIHISYTNHQLNSILFESVHLHFRKTVLMLYIGKEIKFKKDTECVLQKPKDKHIEEQTVKLKELSRENDLVEKQLDHKRSKYCALQKQYSNDYKELCALKQKLLKKVLSL